jgi:UDP-2,3-diacylglucosamine hydrolase
MTISIISDLHLDKSNPYIADLFLAYLKNPATRPKQLYILGDFFESWIGDDDLSPFNQTIVTALKDASASFPIYFMHGNRDFLIGKRFLTMTGMQLLPDEYIIDLHGKPTLLMHGDTLCTDDLAYLTFRKKARNRFFQWLFLMKSLTKRQAIAETMRNASKKYTTNATDKIMDVNQSAVQAVMRKHQVLQLIHGHTHRPNMHTFDLDGQIATRLVLAAWHETGAVLQCHADGRQDILVLT